MCTGSIFFYFQFQSEMIKTMGASSEQASLYLSRSGRKTWGEPLFGTSYAWETSNHTAIYPNGQTGRQKLWWVWVRPSRERQRRRKTGKWGAEWEHGSVSHDVRHSFENWLSHVGTEALAHAEEKRMHLLVLNCNLSECVRTYEMTLRGHTNAHTKQASQNKPVTTSGVSMYVIMRKVFEKNNLPT